MNTIERIEARGPSWFTGSGDEKWMRITADEWAAIKAVVGAASAARDWFFAPNAAAISAGKVDMKLREALSKLEGE